MLVCFMVFVIRSNHVLDLLFRYGPFHQILTSSLILNSDYDGSGHKWKLNNDQRLVTILVHYCTDPNIFIFSQIQWKFPVWFFENIFRKWPYLDQYIFAGTTGTGALVYLIFASAEPQPSIIGDIETKSEEVEKDIHGDNKYVKEPLRNWWRNRYLSDAAKWDRIKTY